MCLRLKQEICEVGHALMVPSDEISFVFHLNPCYKFDSGNYELVQVVEVPLSIPDAPETSSFAWFVARGHIRSFALLRALQRSFRRNFYWSRRRHNKTSDLAAS